MATLPTMDTWTSGEIPTAAKLNKNIRDTGNFLLNPPSVGVTKATPEGFNTATYTALAFNTEDWDTDSMWAAGPNITVNTAGLWLLTADIGFAANATGVRMSYIAVNGNNVDVYPLITNAVSGYETHHRLVTQRRLAVGNTIQVLGRQDSGSNITVTGSFQATWLGK